MRQAGIKDSNNQATLFAQALNKADFFLLSSSEGYREETKKGTTINNIQTYYYTENKMPIISKTLMATICIPNQRHLQISHTSIDTGASQPEILSETAWSSKMKEFAARSPADKKRLGKRCHICNNFGCHS
jgi:hypothetical protein